MADKMTTQKTTFVHLPPTELLLGNEVLPKHVASMYEESTGFLFQKSTDEVGVKIDIRH
jgi:hypothetical protein